MNKNKKYVLAVPCGILALSIAGYTGYELGKNSNSSNQNLIQNVKEIKKIAYADKISDIVVTEITDDGYVTLHGDHSHYEKGLVPYNAKFLDKIIYKNPNYRLKNEDIQYEVAQGYIIKVDGKYYYYPKDGVKQTNVVDEATAKIISATSHHHHDHSDSSSHGDNYQFNPKDIVKETADGYVVRHGDHYHFIKKSDLTSAQLNAAKSVEINNQELNDTAGITHTTSDGYIFKGEGDIVGQNSFGFIVKHGSHNHIIPFDSLRGTQWEYLLNKDNSSIPSSVENITNNSTTSDDYHFNPKDIVAEDENGYTVRHNDHYHYIPKQKNSNSNSNTTNNYDNSTPTTPNVSPVKLTKEIEEKVEHLASMLNIDKGTIKVIETNKGKALVYPHGDHYHTVFVNEIHTENNSNNTSNKDIEKQKDYIADVYGVPKEAIRVTADFFIFNEPTQEYDPTHIHPYLIPRSKFRIPEITGDKELDFEQELLALSERTGIAPDKIKVERDKFVIPHGSHNHYVKIKSDGAEVYLKNKIPNIIGNYINGELNKETIINKIDKLIAENNKINNDKKQAHRINRALNQLKSSINDLATNSTEGYLAMLDNFDKKYIHIDSSSLNENNEQFIKIYNELLTRVKNSNIEHLGYEKENLINELNIASANHNTDAFNRISHLLNELEKFDTQTGPTTLSYTKYFLKNINSPKIDNELREELAYLIKYSYLGEAQIVDSHAEELIARLINAKNKLHYQLENNKEEEIKYGNNYAELNNKFNEDDENSILKSAQNFINELGDFLPNLEFSKANNSNELETKFNSDKFTAKSNDEGVNKENSAEENTNETDKEVEATAENTENKDDKNSENPTPTASSHEASDNFSFNIADVLEETADGFVVRHHDHTHYVYKNTLSADQIKQAQEFLLKK